MIRLLVVSFIALFLFSNSAIAQTCSGYPWTTLTDGYPAVASQVMNNFNCVLSSPSFAGKVGIGTTTPDQKLHIYSPGGSDSYALIENGGTSDIAGLLLKGGGSPLSYWFLATNRADIGGNAGNIFLYNGVSLETTVTVTPGGNVGIGTANPSQKLHLYSSGGGTSLYELIENSGTTPNNDLAGLIVRGGATNANWVLGTNRADVGGAAANFFLFNGTTAAKPVVVTPTGNVGIGALTPGQALEVGGQVQVDMLASASSTNLCITGTSNGILATCSSSIRYKEDVKIAKFGLKEIQAMRPVTFKWKGRSERDFGLIAEEVANVNPLFVTYKNGRIEGVKYPQLTAVLINAIKELQTENEQRAAELIRYKYKEADELRKLRADVQQLKEEHQQMTSK